MAAANFDRCLAFTFKEEGGYSDTPGDSGGATNLGITHITLALWRKVPSVTADDVRNLGKPEAEAIYRARYWNAGLCDMLPAGVDAMIFDEDVNAGDGGSAKILQRIVGTAADGVIGPITLAATLKMDPAALIIALQEAQDAYYRSLGNFALFGKNWIARLGRRTALAQQLLAEAPRQPIELPLPAGATAGRVIVPPGPWTAPVGAATVTDAIRIGSGDGTALADPPTQPPVSEMEPMWSPQSVIAFLMMLIVAGTIGAIIYSGDAQLRSQVLGGVMGLASAVAGFYFGASSGSRGKDRALAALSAKPPHTLIVQQPKDTQA